MENKESTIELESNINMDTDENRETSEKEILNQIKHEPSLELDDNSESDSQDTERTSVDFEDQGTFQLPQQLQLHGESKHTSKSNFECGDCGRKFLKKQKFEKHVKTHTSDVKCHICNNRFYDNNKELIQHQFKYHWDKFICSFCTLSYFTTNALEDHVKEEHPSSGLSKPKAFECNICKAVLTTKTHLLSHIERIHKIICGECHETFSSRSELFEHLVEQHHPEYLEADEGPEIRKQGRGISRTCRPKCYLCGRLFNNRTSFKKHFWNKHPSLPLKMQFKCLDCEDVFDDRGEANSHFKLHHSEKEEANFKCEICFETFTRITQIKQHMKYFHASLAPHPKPLRFVFGRCKECQYETTSKMLLLHHSEKIHPGLEVNVENKCSECEEFFKTTEDTRQHWILVHQASSLKNIYGRCTVCKQLSSTRTVLLRHFEKLHPSRELDIDIKCKECDEFFKTQNDVRQHSRKAHKTSVDFGGFLREKEDFYKTLGNDDKEQSAIVESPITAVKKENFDESVSNDETENFIKSETREKPSTSLLKTVYGRCMLCKQQASTRGNLVRHFVKLHPCQELDIEIKCKKCDEFFQTQVEVRHHSRITHITKLDFKNFLKEKEDFYKTLQNGSDVKEQSANVDSSIMKIKTETFDESVSNELLEKDTENILVKSSETIEQDFPTTFKTEESGFEIQQNMEHGTSEEDSDGEYESEASNPPMKTEIENDESSFQEEVSNSKPNSRKRPKYFINARCQFCQQLFKTNFTLKRHYENMHPGFEPNVDYKCRECDEFFKTTEEVRQHSKIAHQGKDDQPKAIYGKCNVCKYLAGTRGHLVRHFERKHAGYQFDFEFKCKDCPEFFKSTEEVMRHTKVVHQGKEDKPRTIFGRCLLCKQVTTTRCNLRRHYKNSHPGSEFIFEYKCINCEEFFKTTEEISQHSKVAHQDLEPDVNGCNYEEDFFNSKTIKEEDYELNGDQKFIEGSDERMSASEYQNVISFSVFEVENGSNQKVEVKIEKDGVF